MFHHICIATFTLLCPDGRMIMQVFYILKSFEKNIWKIMYAENKPSNNRCPNEMDSVPWPH